MAKRIIWSQSASEDKINIFTYWNKRNKSKEYSIKLNKMFNAAINLLYIHSNIGKQTDFRDIRYLIVRHYNIYYRELEDCFRILAVWDARQDPSKLIERLK